MIYSFISTPYIKNLYRNFNEGIFLEETLKKLEEELKKIPDNKSNKIIRNNLTGWIKRYKQRISIPEKYEKYYTSKGLNIPEKLIQNYIYKNGIKLSFGELKKFEKEKEISIGRIDLLGIDNNHKYIIEVKKGSVRAKIFGQVLSYYQALKEEENLDCPIIIVGNSFTEQYFIVERALRDKFIIFTVRCLFKGDKIEFEEL